MDYRTSYTGVRSGQLRLASYATFADAGRAALTLARKNPGRRVKIMQRWPELSRPGAPVWRSIAAVTWDRVQQGWTLADPRTGRSHFEPLARRAS